MDCPAASIVWQAMSSIRVADRYALDREIGRGGSGAVWLARDEVLGRFVALKRIGLPPGASATDLARAEREARLAARVNHPNVIAVFDFVEEGDQQWLVTEYVDGTTFAQTIRERGGLQPDEAAPVLLQAAEALAAAHELNIVHRDVKPSNILIGRDGTVKLSDFGIARAVADASLTQTGLVTGSPAYLAPEIATGSSATLASDVWSFGTTAFHALAGRPPYDVAGGAVLAVLHRVASEDPPRLADAGWLTPLLEATMQRNPALRPTMEDVAAFLRAGPQEAPPVATQVLPAAGPPAERTDAVEGPVPAAPATSAARRGVVGRIMLPAVALVALLAVVGVVLVRGSGDDAPEGTAHPGGADSSTTDATGGATDTPATAEELEAFASSYVNAAAGDPDAGFAMLTPDYQARSPQYAEFWSAMSNPRILGVSADPADMTVTYTYRYNWPGAGNRTERVTLHLVRDGDRLLIDDAVSSGPIRG